MTGLQYFPGVNFFKTLFASTHGEFSRYEDYRKGGFSNRCLIAGANGVIKLSVPIVGGRNQKSLLRDITIVKDQDWQIRHFKTIKSCYNRSPWFEEYHDSLAELYKKKFNFLADWNLRCLEWACSALEWNGKISWVQSPPAYKNAAGDDTMHVLPADKIIRYRQVFEDRIGFIPNLSILDLLFCEGGHARSLLTGQTMY